MEAQAVKLEHRVDGPDDAQVVVLGNSLGTNMEMWDPNVAVLAEHFRVVRYNPRGHSGSDVPDGPYSMEELGADVLALLDDLGISTFDYAGVSLGAMIGMQVASAAPERVERLVIGPSAAHLGPPSIWNDRAHAVRTEGTGSVAAAVVARWFTDGYKQRRPEVVAEIEAMVSGNPDEGHAGCVEAIRDMDLRPVLSNITAKTLIISGADDPATPVEHQATIASLMPDARWVTIKPGAHLASLEQPDLFSALLRAHFDSPLSP